jgi:hypothetical protein
MRITRAEARIRKRRRLNAEIKRQRSQRGTSREASNALKARWEAGRAYEETQKELIWALRAIGDAVAFIDVTP